jgi:hypothetical protein
MSLREPLTLRKRGNWFCKTLRRPALACRNWLHRGSATFCGMLGLSLNSGAIDSWAPFISANYLLRKQFKIQQSCCKILHSALSFHTLFQYSVLPDGSWSDMKNRNLNDMEQIVNEYASTSPPIPFNHSLFYRREEQHIFHKQSIEDKKVGVIHHEGNLVGYFSMWSFPNKAFRGAICLINSPRP